MKKFILFLTIFAYSVLTESADRNSKYDRFYSGLGTLALPALSFNTDKDTGIYSSGANTLKLVTGGALGLTVDSSQNVTIPGDLTVSTNGIFDGAFTLTTPDGFDLNPGSDIDTDILTIGVTGAPKLQWDESSDAFRFTHNLILGADGDGVHTINGSSVTSGLEIHSEGGTDPDGVSVHRHTASTQLGGHFLGLRSRGTHASPTIVQSGDSLARFMGTGFDGTDYAQGAQIAMRVDGTPGANDMPGRIDLETSADGAQTPTVALRVDSGQNTNIMGAKELRFQDTTGGEYMGFKAPGTVTSSTTLTLPDGPGTTGQVLVTNGSNTLSWADAAGGGDLVVTGSRGTPEVITAAGGISYVSGSGPRQQWYIESDTTAGTDISANPQIVAGATDGQELVIVGRTDDKPVIFEDGTGLALNGTFTAYANSTLYLRWDGSVWVEIGRNGL